VSGKPPFGSARKDDRGVLQPSGSASWSVEIFGVLHQSLMAAKTDGDPYIALLASLEPRMACRTERLRLRRLMIQLHGRYRPAGPRRGRGYASAGWPAGSSLLPRTQSHNRPAGDPRDSAALRTLRRTGPWPVFRRSGCGPQAAGNGGARDAGLQAVGCRTGPGGGEFVALLVLLMAKGGSRISSARTPISPRLFQGVHSGAPANRPQRGRGK
jgi:hypothetical protein